MIGGTAQQHTLALPFDSTELLDLLSTGVLLLDGELRVLYANAGTQDLLGFGNNQVRGRSVSSLFANETALQKLLGRALERREICSGHELTLIPVAALHGPRPAVVVDAIVTPTDSQRSGGRLLLELVDARLRLQLSRESELASRVDGNRLMARQLAHEIRNPLGGLRGAAQLLERELQSPQLREYTTVIISEADRLRTLVDTMLGPTRPPQKELLNVHEVCEHVLKLLRSEAPLGVSIERDYDPSVPDAPFARSEIIQALLNVARNALQAVVPVAGNGGRVILRTRVLTNHAINGVGSRLVCCMQVEDNGPGVPDELRKTLFMPLVTGRSEGTGLGLAVAQDMMARHAGIVEFDSAPGRTVFSLLLPLESVA
jgi:two-component system, NtrC family, nitrogen regulation sensor histidine kinase GlnL